MLKCIQSNSFLYRDLNSETFKGERNEHVTKVYSTAERNRGMVELVLSATHKLFDWKCADISCMVSDRPVANPSEDASSHNVNMSSYASNSMT